MMYQRNQDIAEIFSDIADLLELQGGPVECVRRYRRAALAAMHQGQDVAEMLDDMGPRDTIPALGAELTGQVREILTSGESALLRGLRQEASEVVRALLTVPGLGAKRIRALCAGLQLETTEQLLGAARKGQLSAVRGLGPRMERRILDAFNQPPPGPPQLDLIQMQQQAQPLVAYLHEAGGVSAVSVTGSMRRRRGTVGNIDLLAGAPAAQPVIERLARYGETRSLLARSATRVNASLRGGVSVDLRVVPPTEYGAAQLFFTGSHAHSQMLRQRAREHGLLFNEHGVFCGATRVAGHTEVSVYAALDLPWIPPELRENFGEIDDATNGRLPHLVEDADLCGDLHVRANACAGDPSLLAMALAARHQGLVYLGVTLPLAGWDAGPADPAATVARFARHSADIAQLNQTLHGVVLLRGAEVPVGNAGYAAFPAAVLREVDFVIGVMDRLAEHPTEQLLRALDHPHMRILCLPDWGTHAGHRALAVNWDAVLRRAQQRRCHLELDLRAAPSAFAERLFRTAKAQGVRIVISSQARTPADFVRLHVGINVARRSGLERRDVLNGRSLAALRPMLL